MEELLEKQPTKNLKTVSEQSSKPTPHEMKEFASRFTKQEWERLCMRPSFLRTITEDLKQCRVLAERILAGKE